MIFLKTIAYFLLINMCILGSSVNVISQEIDKKNNDQVVRYLKEEGVKFDLSKEEAIKYYGLTSKRSTNTYCKRLNSDGNCILGGAAGIGPTAIELTTRVSPQRIYEVQKVLLCVPRMDLIVVRNEVLKKYPFFLPSQSMNFYYATYKGVIDYDGLIMPMEVTLIFAYDEEINLYVVQLIAEDLTEYQLYLQQDKIEHENETQSILNKL